MADDDVDGWDGDDLPLEQDLGAAVEEDDGGHGANATGPQSAAEEPLRDELRQLRHRLEESEQACLQDREDLEARMQEVMQKAKDRMLQMQQMIRNKDEQLQEVELERNAALTAAASAAAGGAARDRDSAEQRADSEERSAARLAELEQECRQLRSALERAEEDSRRAQAEAVEADSNAEAASRAREAEAAKAAEALAQAAAARAALEAAAAAGGEEASPAEASLKAELQERERELQQVREEMEHARELAETTLADVVRKSKEHLRQLQSRLQTSLSENNELAEKHKETEELYRQQQDKVLKYKQLMAQANSRIEESDASVRELREALSKSQSQRLGLQEQMGSLGKSLSVPPTQQEIAQRGGILLAVESDNDDVWCLISTGLAVTPEEGAAGEEVPEAAKRARWWLLSQLDMAERPIPLQRRWKGEVSALRAQMQRFKKKSEDLQEEFDTYREKANAALQSTASHSQEIQLTERRAEQLGEQLQATALELQRAQADKARSAEELREMRRKLQEASARSAELERAMERKAREADEGCAAAVESCRAAHKASLEELERGWREKERAVKQELDLRRADKQALDEEVDGLRALLDSRAAAAAAATAAAAAAAEAPATAPEPPRSSPLATAKARDEGGVAEQSASSRSASNADLQSDTSPELTSSASPVAPERPPELPAQAYALHTSVAWQDLVSLRAQVRQLEGTMLEEREKYLSAKRESEKARNEVLELTMQQRLQNTVGQHQQMEYIRNVFRKFVETLPVANKEHEQLIPVLMTFFKFGDDDVRTIQTRRGAVKQGLWGLFAPKPG